MNKIVLLGAGGAGKAVLQILKDINSDHTQWDIVGFLDDDISLHSKNIMGYNVLGALEWIKGKEDIHIVLTFGITTTRKKVYDRINKWGGYKFPKIIHPKASVPSNVEVGEGTVIYPYAVFDPNIVVGDFCLINKGVSVGHDAKIQSFSIISPNSSIGGYSSIGTLCFLGMNVSVIQNISICDNVVVGAGASVVKSIKESGIFVGVPAKMLVKNNLQKM